MNRHTIGLAVLLLAAVAGTGSAQRRGIRTCSCQIGNGHSQQGKLVGRVCYVVGVGSCRSFTYEGSSQQQQQQPQQHQQQQQQQQQQQFASQRRFGQHRFPFRSGFQSRYDTNRPSRFNTNRPSQFATRQSQFAANQPTTQFPAGRPTPPYPISRPTPSYPTSRPAGRYDSGRYDIAAAAATASPEQHRSAAEETRRQLESRRTYERELAASGVTVRPGSPEAALASERKPDDKSADLGNKALAQILYLQSLLGRSGRR